MELNGQTAVYGIIGYPVKHSKSPTFQTKAFQHLNINAVYLPFEVKPEDLEKAIQGIKALSIKGFNITVPHKEEVIKYLDEVSPEVEYIGACNTVVNIDGYLKGYNTDAYGFITGLKELEPSLEGKKVLVIGAGGASRAVIYSLIKEGVDKIYLANRTIQKAEKLKLDFLPLSKFVQQIIQPITLDQIDNYLPESEIIVNTTSVGLKENDPHLFDYSKINKNQTVVDIIYKQTPLLKVAQEKGCKWQDGLPMLLYQGAKAFQIWTGKEPPIDIMEEVLKS
ncbi:MAG: shikimate dehydrogenase [Aquificae bacterium]|nr:shikimate dehydrogenase [Aquificota bacterium]